MGIALLVCFILLLVFGFGMMFIFDEWIGYAVIITFILCCVLAGIGCFTGFVNYPATEGTHVGVVTAVDLEGVYFRRYQVYLKSSGYTNQSDETVYLLYDYEKELAEELKSCLGKEVKLTYGHDGGYIAWNECGTYHIKSFEKIKG